MGARHIYWPSSGNNEPIVCGMSTDPNPRDSVGGQSAKGPVVISDANAEAIVAALQPTEAERGMMRVAAPQLVILDRQCLNVRWKRVEQIPETMRSNGVHFRGGHSLRSPLANSLSASRKRKSRLPAEESRSICSSQRVCSRARSQSTRRRYSSGGRLLIAASISSTRSIPGG